jgi:hypothetical protein
MKSETDLAELLSLICTFYNHYRETLKLSHEEAKQKIINMYSDFNRWLYDEDEQC